MKYFLLSICIVFIITICPAYDWDMVFGIDEPVHGCAYFWNPPYYNLYFSGTWVLGFNEQGYFEIDTGLRVTHAVQLEEDIMILTDPAFPGAGIYWLDVETSAIIDTFLLGEFYFLAKDEDEGSIWAGCSSGSYRKFPDDEEFTYYSVDNAMYCAAFFGQNQVFSCIHFGQPRIFYSINGGEQILESDDNVLLSDISFAPDGSIYGLGIGQNDIPGIYMSSDQGEHWGRILEDGYISSIATDCYGNLFTGCNVPQSTLPGVSARHRESYMMIPLNEGLPSLLVNDISLCPTLNHQHMIACTDEGVYIVRNYQNELAIENNAGIDKRAFGLRNFPNPFNPSTTISFELAQEEEVSLSVYNIKGQLVNHLISREKRDAGSYFVVWDGKSSTGESVSSGMYFYKLETSDTVVTRRMLLIK